MEESLEDGEEVVSIAEVIDGMEAEQLEADLVLGGDEGKECTYQKGYMRRQAVFSCLTCTSVGNAGFCTACSLVCHDGHEVVELWTRRGFRCDCGNDKFEGFDCKLYKYKESFNEGNVYNQNYGGLYCTCHRPFPDPDKAEQSEMLQCCICEDWFHETHLGLASSDQVPRDDDGEPTFDELICPTCASRCSFLSQYPELLVPLLQSEGEVEGPPPTSLGKVADLDSSVVLQNGSAGLALEPSLPGRDSVEAPGSSRESSRLTAEECSLEGKLGSSCKENAGVAIGESSNGGLLHCKLTQPDAVRSGDGVGEVRRQGAEVGQAMFLTKSWRSELCQCESCVAMYVAKEVRFLLDREDTLQEYEEVAKRKREENEDGTIDNFMKKLGHVQKIELFHGFNDMATGLGEFLTPFGQAGKTVTSADIYEFFEELQQKRKRKN